MIFVFFKKRRSLIQQIKNIKQKLCYFLMKYSIKGPRFFRPFSWFTFVFSINTTNHKKKIHKHYEKNKIIKKWKKKQETKQYKLQKN